MNVRLQTSVVDELIDRLEAAAISPANRRRIACKQRAVFQTEDPIAGASLFGYDANRLFTDVDFYVEQTLKQKLWRWELFPDDEAPITLELPAWLSHYPEYTYIGMAVSFDARGVPLLQNDHPLSRRPDLSLLKALDFYGSGWMPRALEWYDAIQKRVGDRLAVPFNMTWWRGCLDLAIQLRGYENFLIDVIERPQFVHDLMRFLTEQRCRWYEELARHFGVSVSPTDIGDDWINIPFITPDIFADFVLPRYIEIEAFHGGIRSIHSCGNQAPVQRYLLEIRSLGAFEVSPWTDLDQSLVNIPDDKELVISLHPNDVLCATADEMEQKLRTIAGKCAGRLFQIKTSGLTPITAAPVFVERIQTWTRLAHAIMEVSRRDNAGLPGWQTTEEADEVSEFHGSSAVDARAVGVSSLP